MKAYMKVETNENELGPIFSVFTLVLAVTVQCIDGYSDVNHGSVRSHSSSRLTSTIAATYSSQCVTCEVIWQQLADVPRAGCASLR